ncbi:CPBP family intramembrane metalloprotease [Natronospirillum operosum]|uniref:CPBP family intramembrane metalloprotease n=1 Tax=Natronospirillum operosum TaxID=2759953 RepID=A0A4Z0WCU2_9GAMM|nr:CPBP family intramembrane glutamic endopeptidase [Natronospirillum operosum]TGG95674.1 CPBP family intramembrane metalloprotease [Natronospirillum operosum]
MRLLRKSVFSDLRALPWTVPAVPLILLAAVVLVFVAPLTTLSAIWQTAPVGLVTVLIMLLLSVPLFLLPLWSARIGKQASWAQAAPELTDIALALMLVGTLLSITMVALMLPRVGPFQYLDWNWQGKTLDMLWLLTLIVLLPGPLRRELGWQWRIYPGTGSAAAINIVLWGAIGFLITRQGMFGDPVELARTDLTLERLLFDISHPNLAEEILFRGLLLAVLDRVFRPNWTLFGARMGWGVIITAWLFGLAHGVAIDTESSLLTGTGSGLGITLDMAWLAQSFVMGLVLGWIRALTGSLWPAFLGHCAPELGILLALSLY